jgi:outer membrane receptor protein involved in Fe transport
MNLRTLELAFTGSVDPYFDASVFLVFEGESEIEVEEAWFATRSMPAGLRLKGGKFLSEFGYVNKKHEHQWEFVDQNLPYLNLLGDHGLQDTGVQMTWLPKTPFYTLFGVEVLQGDQERVGAIIDDEAERAELGFGDTESGPRLWTLFAKLSPDLGYDHTLQIGGSFVHNRQHQEIHGEDPLELGLEGSADLWGLDVVYKYDNAAAYGYRDLSIQAEYLRSIKDMTVRGGDPGIIGESLELTTDGLYMQGTFGFAQRWQAGLRYDVLGLTNKVSGVTINNFESSERWTTALTWTPTEFSRFRLQYSRNDLVLQSGTREEFDAFWLQFLMSLGAHGAHDF